MTFEKFEEKFNDLSVSDRISIYNDYTVNYGDPDGELFNFDEEFFDLAFTDKMEVCRATAFGDVNFNDEYIHFNAYGNLKSLCEWEALELVEEAIHEIYDHCDTWEEYIEFEDDDEEEEEEVTE